MKRLFICVVVGFMFPVSFLSANWIVETDVVDDSADVGVYNSIAIDALGTVHVAYYDADNKDLKYAAQDDSGSWSNQVIESSGDVGSYCALATDGFGEPHVSYCTSYQQSLPIPPYTVFDLGKLKYVVGESGTPVIVDGGTTLWSQYTAIALNDSGEPRVVYHDATNGDLFYVEKTGAAWGTPVEVESGGKGASIAIDSAGRAHIAHVFGTTLRYAYWNGTTWQASVVVGDDVIQDECTSIAIDSSGNPHIVFVSEWGLEYTYWNGSSWNPEVVHSIANMGAVGISSPSLDLNSNDEPFISYHGNLWGDLAVVVAVRIGVHNWSFPIWLLENTVPGGQTSIAIDSNDVMYVSFHDNTAETLGYARVAEDSDDDGLPDWWEMKYFQDLDQEDFDDPDSDGDDNITEYENGTDPMVDEGGQENDDDRDGDGLSNDDEVNIHGTDPDDPDSDDDGLADGHEVGYTYMFESFEADEFRDDWTLGGDGLWTTATDSAYDETSSAKSADIAVNSSAWFEFVATNMPAGELYFWYRTDSLQDHHELTFYINGIEQMRDSGVHDWTIAGTNLTAGSYTCRWEVVTDGTAVPANNAIWVDHILWDVIAAGTSPTNSDSDADGLLDGAEVNTYGTDPLVADSDGDGLNDGDEVNLYGTNPNLVDTDLDLMPDGWEVTHTLNPTNGTDAAVDIEPDGLTNLEEYQEGTDPRDADSDSDLMPDGWEVTHTLNPTNATDAAVDIEPDGLSNLEEYQKGTDPRDADSDSDLMPDGWEVTHTLNPTNGTDAAVDIEPDGLTNLEEYQSGTDPRDADSDSDLMPDGWEVMHTLNPTNGTDAAVDIEPDGLSNLEEYQNGTDPRNKDTDADGLEDAEELNVIGSSPLLQDSDSDGLPDGQETSGVGMVGFGFEDGTLPAGVVLTGDTNWYVEATDTVQGEYAARSGDMSADFLYSQLSYTMETAAGTGSFWYSVIVSPNDEFEFFVNGSRKLSTYASPWTNFTFNVNEGTNTFSWKFQTRSGGVRSGSEAALIDQLMLPVAGTGTSPTNSDSDADGLLDGEELNTYHTDPTIADSDSDGLSDGDEVDVYGTLPLNPDTDADGLSDGDEVHTYTTLPLDEDTDNDGLKDGDEVNTYGSNPKNTDSDGDTLNDGYEVKTLGTDPTKKDTDDDGYDDNVETDTGTFVSSSDTGTDPLDSDTDDDGALDGVETDTGTWSDISDRGTDPHDPDTDNDNLDDGAETHTGIYSNQFNAGSNPFDTDTDNDTLSDGDEVHVHHTDPNKVDSDDDGLSDPDEINTHNTNPSDSDSDNDGLNDGDEIYRLVEFRESFEENAIPYGWTTGGDTAWIEESDGAYDGTKSIVSGTLGRGQESWIELSIKTWTNNLTFYRKTYGYFFEDDIFSVRVDGQLKYTHKGMGATWQQISIPLSAGEHTIQWKYHRDAGSDNYNPGGDRALLDLVELMQWDNTDPHDTDSDDDGVSDGDEVHTYGTGPNNVDSDNDGMDDGYEVDNLLNPLVDDTAGDADSDGLNNGDEHSYGSNAQVKDSDGDGIEDGIEVHTYGSNPMDTDSDDDGLEDPDEITYSTGLMDDDSDNDRVKDGAEVYTYGTEPLLFDTDNDGLSDGDELISMVYSNSFEDEYFDYKWATGGDVPWELSTYWPYDGTQHAFSTILPSGKGNTLSLTINVLDGNIVFYESLDMKIGGRALFYINGVSQEQYYPTTQIGWEQKSYPVSQGTNTFTWVVENWSSEPGYFSIDKLSVPTLPETSVLDDDSDNDGVKDGDEVNQYRSNPLRTDTDDDGLTDGQEVNTYGTNPNLSDTDKDGMSDGWEIDNTLMPTNNVDAAVDIEPDGLTNLEEFQNNTNPRESDTDSDGMLDGYEVNYGLNPLLDDADLDPDSDGLFNIEEHNAGSNPKSSDTDNDSMPDGWEVDNSLNPTNIADALVDIEPDGLTNVEEYQNGTDPRIEDSDSDNMPDGWEVDNTLIPTNSIDAAVDIEPDGLTNLEEYQNGSDPRVADTDGDNMPDGWEVNYSLNPLVDDANDNNDSDSLTNIEEYQEGTNPSSSDTDGDGLDDDYELNTSNTDPTDVDSDDDGMEDGWEWNHFLDPRVDDASGDADNDGMTNLQEAQAGSDPQSTDSDGDGMLDGWEYDNSLDPAVNDAGGDPDNDGYTNRHEFDNGTDPQVANDSGNKSEFFRIVSDSPTVITGFTPDGWLTWSNSVLGATCIVERATSLASAPPQPASLSMGLKLDATGGNETTWTTNSEVIVTNLIMDARCFYPETKADMTFIPAGYFLMGDHHNEGDLDELPVHSVYVSAFSIGKFEVRYEEVLDVMQWAYDNNKVSNTFHDYGSGEFLWSIIGYGHELLVHNNNTVLWDDDHYELGDTAGIGYPAHVTWFGAIAYCNFLSEIEGLEPCYDLSDSSCDYSKNGYRLPTEAEWERAARGGLYFRFAGFDTISHSQANYYADPDWYDYDYNPVSGYHPDYDQYCAPVGSFDANGYGLFDMTGNILEWCGDWYDEDYYSSSPVKDPRGPSPLVGVERILRGGSYASRPVQCRVSLRVSWSPTTPNNGGFRVVRSSE